MRDHSAKSESKTTDGQASQLHDIQTNNVIVFNPRAISMEVRNFLRRQRWRFRPLKRWVLPARSMKRAALESIGTFFGRTTLRLEPSTWAYANTHTEISVRKIHPAEVVRLPPHPFRKQTSFGELRVGPAFVFEIPNVKSWPRLEFHRRKFAMLIRTNVSRSHRPFFLPWTSTLLLHGKFTACATSLLLANQTKIAAFIFHGHAPRFAGSRMKTKS